MSAVLSVDLIPAPSAADRVSDRPRSAGHTFPVGARFPRRNLDRELAYLATNGAVLVTSSPVFPVGARFPRRSAEEVRAYIGTPAPFTPSESTSPRRLHPVGARFPRRVAN